MGTYSRPWVIFRLIAATLEKSHEKMQGTYQHVLYLSEFFTLAVGSN
jgi:hypothetical protein